MSNNAKKLKLLLFGAVNDQIVVFANKVKALHKSKAGPFDVCFCVGTFHVPAEGSSDYEALKGLPIPVYIQDALMATGKSPGRRDDQEDIQTLIEPHLKAFPPAKSNIYNVSVPGVPHVSLVVASCPRNLRMDDSDSVKPLMDKLSHVSYVGCDLLLTSHWPQGVEGLETGTERQTQLSATYDAAEVALRARARYHVVPSHAKLNHYWQSPPFFHLAGTTSTRTPQHTGRLIALGRVSGEKKVPKEHKFVHALGLVPLHSMDVPELQQSLGQGVAPCPFTDASYSKDSTNNHPARADARAASDSTTTSMMTPAVTTATATSSVGLSEAQARRIIAEGVNGQPQRWNLPGNRKRQRAGPTSGGDGKDALEQPEIDPTNTTLFVHGLHKDVSGQLQQASNSLLLQAFQPYGVIKVRRPPNATTASFAFLEFESHQNAKDCLETLGGATTVAGVNLTLKWASHHNSNNNNKLHPKAPAHKRPRLTEEEAKDSSTLYYRLPHRILPHEFETASEQVRKWMELTLEDALSEEGGRITAAEEPALQVQVRHTADQGYGFLDFASHAAASMALASLTGSTSGGIVPCPPPAGKERGVSGKDEPSAATESVSGKQEPESESNTARTAESKSESNNVDPSTSSHDSSKSHNIDKQTEELELKDAALKSDDAPSKPDSTPSKSDDASPSKPDGSSSKPGDSSPKPPDDTSSKPPDDAPSSKPDSTPQVWGIALHWAHPKPDNTDKKDGDAIIRDADCDFEFGRQHFPPDARHDCWFCLASEGCEKHLIAGVYQQCYSAVPKGAIHKGHVLLIPVAHSSRGAFWDETVSREIRDLQRALRQHAHDEYGMDVFVFERAIQTKGGYHTHVQCVPVPKGLGVKLETTLRAQAKANRIDLREIQSPDLDIAALLGQNDDEEEDGGGYFYAEVPVPGGKHEFKRFLYQVRPQQQTQEDRRRPWVPIQFGREVVAAVMGQSELAHWKACQVDKEEETKLAVELRQSFEKYYTANS